MIKQTVSVEKDIGSFREDRISYYSSRKDDSTNSYSLFLLIHFIPDDFVEKRITLEYSLESLDNIKKFIFNHFRCTDGPYVSDEGLHFLSIENNGFRDKPEGFLYNNGVVEIFYPLYAFVIAAEEGSSTKGFFPKQIIWNLVSSATSGYIDLIARSNDMKRIYGCVSIIGCRDVVSGKNENTGDDIVISSNELIMPPSVFSDVGNSETVDLDMEKSQNSFFQHLGGI